MNHTCQYYPTCIIGEKYSHLCYERRKLPLDECPIYIDRQRHERPFRLAGLIKRLLGDKDGKA